MTEEMSFEEANEKLEKTIEHMENNTLPLRESVELYAQACELLSFCINELEACKGRIEDINEKLKGLNYEEAQELDDGE
ncbi:MAG: exodeoxyribonuclease VII small subunit [Ruminococcus sp.]|nr:exodeoxyribonuclease VII small subunit [Ruminococcus sp.]MBQ1815530.1 exodeoxyribonuclease VII small subunit [Ruminococcus sp.]MEE0675148.1 exodeoxyribonuclease VII small subunit [Ruminococcus sp.]MEE0856972.1 exodeoxyribonuclease VII small subunit [Ruminococcus sp.]MEE1173191.1 exodeoxyribonuclease VII small subunit [Ruminococcus sp.]